MSGHESDQSSIGSSLTPFQIEVARLFFELPDSRGFLLAGGAGLSAQGMTARPTEDLDLFTAPGAGAVQSAAQALSDAARARGWDVERIRDANTFVRLRIDGSSDALLVDLALDAAPQRPATMSILGPTLAPDDLAGRKVVALFDRAEARDFADLYALSARYDQCRLLELAAEVDLGFERAGFADMLRSHARFSDDEIPVARDEVPALRAFCDQWADALAGPSAL